MYEEVPQELVTVVLLSTILERTPLLSCRAHHMSLLERQSIILLDSFAHKNVDTLRCNASTGWLQLSRDVELGNGPLIISNIHLLSDSVQKNLAVVLQRRSGNRRILVTRTKGAHLHPALCETLLLEQFIDYGDVGMLEMVSLPSTPPHLDADALKFAALNIEILPEIMRYMEDIALHVRNHRLVRRGVTPFVYRDLGKVMRLLCVFRGQNYATPELIKIAARLFLPLKIQMCEPEDEPSILYGGDVEVLKHWMQNYDTTIIVENVLENVPIPK